MKRILSLFVLNLFFISSLWAQQTSVNGTSYIISLQTDANSNIEQNQGY